MRVAVAQEHIEVVPLGNGRYRIATGARGGIAYAVASGGTTWVFLDGLTHVIRSRPSTGHGRASRTDDEFALAAPMPAGVVALHVSEGQSVRQGDLLVTLEAMKMELAVRAPRDAVVRNIACRVGDLVQPGVPLLELE